MFYKKILIFISICLLQMNTSLSQNLLNENLSSLADKYGGTIGIAAKNLKIGETIFINAENKFPAASVIKVPIMVEFFYQVAEGKINPSSFVELNDANKWGGSSFLQYFDGTSQIKLIDAVMLMIIVSDNTATNLVIDALGTSHQEKLDAVNNRMEALGLKNTRLLNKLMSWETKTDSPESIRYGVGVTTPEDMALLLEKMYRGELVSLEFSEKMIAILRHQFYNSMIPRYLPFTTTDITVVHKTGGVTESFNDVGIVYSSKTDYVLAIFCDEVQDYRDSPDNESIIAAATASRLIWNYFTGDAGFEVTKRFARITWNDYPSGTWAKLRLKHAPFPHALRKNGYTNSKGEFYPYKNFYDDSSAVIIVPKGWHETKDGVNLIVHFHGHRNFVLKVMEKFYLPQQLASSQKNAILILAQGPKNVPDSFCGNMEEKNGFKYFIDEILTTLKQDSLLTDTKIGNIIITAHSGGYRPAAFVLQQGGLTEFISEVYLFDAFYGEHDKFFDWIKNYNGKMVSIYTDHLADEHQSFFERLRKEHIPFSEKLAPHERLIFFRTDVCHSCVMDGFFEKFLKLSKLDEVEQEN